PWGSISASWVMAIPVLDILAISFMRPSAPQAGFGILLIFPVIWMASSFGKLGAWLGPTIAIVPLWSVALASDNRFNPNQLAPLLSIPIVLIFTSASTYLANSRVNAQRILLRSQTNMLEAALERTRVQESLITEALDAIDLSVISLSPQGRVITANKATHRMSAEFGFAIDGAFTGMPVYRSDRTTPVQQRDLPHARALRGEPVQSETVWLGHPGDKRVALDISARRIRDTHGKVQSVVMVSRDVTGEADAIQARDDLVTSVSHELRTPLTSILGYLDLVLEDETLAPRTREMLDIALKNGDRLLSLVADFLTARDRGASGGMKISLSECDFAEIVGESIQSVRPVAIERIIAVGLEPSPNVPLVADPFRLRQVVDNLLSNAIKYNTVGGRVTALITTTELSDGRPAVELKVVDTGRGMTPQEQTRLFEKFYRAESVRGSTIHGTGLGLSITREIVKLHHGTITVESEPTQGTTVTVTLPLDASLNETKVRS
ncbi:MAG: sensor histidine kinase, partial [Nocardioidaceae bacterium]|nr:sensor histidine kinase [Nocardioidaceae bacterium]